MVAYKNRVYQAVVRPILLYGCETWPVRVADERLLDALTVTASAAFYTGRTEIACCPWNCDAAFAL